VYATGLQVAKDPGVWTVYAGCALMLIGLYVAFFLSHRRVWVYITREEAADRCRILVCGGSSKNRIAFEKEFAALVEGFTHESTLQNA
jgi:cytochrome c biogenesis protein